MSVFKSLDRSTVVTSTSAILDDHDQIRHAVHHDRRSGAWTTLSRDSTAWTRVRASRCPRRRRTDAPEGAPRSDVVPSEIAGQHDHAVAALEHADVDRDRRHGAEKSANVVRVGVQRRRHFRAVSRRTSSRKSPTTPDKDARVPQVPVAPHLFGASAVRLLDEARDPWTPRSSSLPGWM